MAQSILNTITANFQDDIVSESQCGFRYTRRTVNMIIIVKQRNVAIRTRASSLCLCMRKSFLKCKPYKSVTHPLRVGLPPQIWPYKHIFARVMTAGKQKVFSWIVMTQRIKIEKKTFERFAMLGIWQVTSVSEHFSRCADRSTAIRNSNSANITELIQQR